MFRNRRRVLLVRSAFHLIDWWPTCPQLDVYRCDGLICICVIVVGCTTTNTTTQPSSFEVE